MERVRWGIIGCGGVTEVKSGPGFQKADGSSLIAVMRRDRTKAEDYAHRHGVPRVHATADALIADPDVDAVYIATPPGTHGELSVQTAAAGKPCLVEKPMARNHSECIRMVETFARAGTPLWVAYYRRALPRFLKVKELLDAQAVETQSALAMSQARWSTIAAAADRRRALGLDPATLAALDDSALLSARTMTPPAASTSRRAMTETTPEE